MSIFKFAAHSLHLLFVFLATVTAADSRVTDSLQPERWQLLPETVKSVYVSPDGRCWYQHSRASAVRPDAELRSSLEKEYREPSPQISGATIALLEPGGRAWFFVKGFLEAWGYDGTTWIERKAAPGSRFIGTCPTLGQLPDNLCNQFAGGRAWLRDHQGIHIFDGNDWSHTALCPPLNMVFEFPRLAVSPSGRFAAALTPKAALRMPYLTTPDVWLCENGDGAWRKRDIKWTDPRSMIGTMCITDDGTMWCVYGTSLRKFSLGLTDQTLQRLPELIAQLDHDDFQTRERAYDSLAAVAEQIQPHIKEALKKADSPEKKRRLEALVQQVEGPKSTSNMRPVQPTAFGPFHVQQLNSIFQDDAGKLYLFGGAISQANARPGNGLAILEPSGESEFYPFPSRGSAFSTPRIGPGPILTPQKDALWLPKSLPAVDSASRLDLSQRQITAQTPDNQFGSIRAVDSEGRAFLSRRDPFQFADMGYGLGLFNPEIVDSRPQLEFTKHPNGAKGAVVASDGSVWAWRGGEGLMRYDGSRWNQIHTQQPPRVSPLLAARDNVVLCSFQNEYVLLKDNRWIAVGPLRNLIEAFSAIFVAAFPPDFTPRLPSSQFGIATDTQGNIWLAEAARISAWNGKDWLEASEAANYPPGLRTVGPTAFLSTVGDGSKVYFSSISPDASFLAHVHNGAIHLTEARRGPTSRSLPVGFRTRDGDLWLPSYLTAKGNNFSITTHRTCRISEFGAVNEFANDCWPVHIDHSDNVWLAKMGSIQPRCRFWISAGAKLDQEISIPGADYVYAIFSDKPQSTYVWTTLGLHHLKCSEGTGRWSLDRTYAMPGNTDSSFDSMTSEWAYSELAGLVITTRENDQYQLCFVRLPTE